MESMNRFGKPNPEPSSEAPADNATATSARTTGRVIDIDDTMIGRHFHHFEVRTRLGHAAAGTVYLAQDLSLQQPVMLTLLRRPPATDEQIGDVLAAPRHQARIAHQNVAQVRFVGAAEGNPFVVTEHVEGRSLRDEIKHTGAISWIDAVAYMVQIVRALQAADAVGLYHGALSPANIILHRRGPDSSSEVDVKVDGFGAAAATDGNPYLSPERRAGAPAGMRGDMYALGVIFHEMLTAAPPRPERGLSERLAPHYIRRLVAFLQRQDPKQRPSSYDELLGRLEVALIEPPAVQPIGARVGAFAIDILTLALTLVGCAVLLPRFAPASPWETIHLGLVMFAGYSVWAHKNGGQTLGKQICGVVMVEPRQGLSWGRAMLRVLIQLWGLFAMVAAIDIDVGFAPTLDRIVGQLGGALAVIAALWIASLLVVLTDKHGLALHDHVAGTSVASQ